MERNRRQNVQEGQINVGRDGRKRESEDEETGGEKDSLMSNGFTKQ